MSMDALLEELTMLFSLLHLMQVDVIEIAIEQSDGHKIIVQ